MLLSILISLFVGAILSRSKVRVLFPVILLILVIAIGVALFHTDAILATALTAAVAITGLQIGYLLGAVVRDAKLRAAESRLRSTSLTS